MEKPEGPNGTGLLSVLARAVRQPRLLVVVRPPGGEADDSGDEFEASKGAPLRKGQGSDQDAAGSDQETRKPLTRRNTQ